MSATHRSGRSSSAGTGEPGCAAIPIGRRVDQARAAGHRGGEPVRRGRTELDLRRPRQRRRGRQGRGRGRGRGRRPAAVARRARRARARRRCRRRRRPAARPGRGRRRAAPSAKDSPEAGDVGVVPDGPAVADQHGVERADRGHLGSDLVDQRHHRLLDRVGDVEPVEAELDRRREQVAQALAVDRAVGLVDDLVDVAQPLPLRLPLVQLRGQRRPDALADQPGEPATVAAAPAVTAPASRAGTGSRPARR